MPLAALAEATQSYFTPAPLPTSTVDATKLTLTAAQQAYVAEHPVLTVAYGLWEAVIVDVPPGPRVLIIGLSSAYLLIAAVRVALLRRRRQRAQTPPDVRA